MKKRNADAEGGGRGSKGGGELGHAEEMLMINALLCGFRCDECLLLTGPPLVRRLPLPLVRSWVLR